MIDGMSKESQKAVIHISSEKDTKISQTLSISTHTQATVQG